MLAITMALLLQAEGVAPLEAANLKWERLPTGRDFAQTFPNGAARREIEGVTTVVCVVQRDRRVGDCMIEAERPDGFKFGQAGLRIATKFQLAPGAAPVGARVRINLRFNLPKG